MTHKIYDSISIETEIMEASPHRQIQLLYEKAVQQINVSKHCMERNDIPNKCKAITKAMDIISYLRVILDRSDEKTKKLSDHIEEVYVYVEQSLLYANMRNEVSYLNSALNQITKLKDAWDAIQEEVHENQTG